MTLIYFTLLKQSMFITDDNKKTFKAIILLDEMINSNHPFKTV